MADPPVPTEALRDAYEVAHAESRRRIYHLTGNPDLKPTPLIEDADRAIVDAVAPSIFAAGVAAGRTRAAADILEHDRTAGGMHPDDAFGEGLRTAARIAARLVAAGELPEGQENT